MSVYLLQRDIQKYFPRPGGRDPQFGKLRFKRWCCFYSCFFRCRLLLFYTTGPRPTMGKPDHDHRYEDLHGGWVVSWLAAIGWMELGEWAFLYSSRDDLERVGLPQQWKKMREPKPLTERTHSFVACIVSRNWTSGCEWGTVVFNLKFFLFYLSLSPSYRLSVTLSSTPLAPDNP